MKNICGRMVREEWFPPKEVRDLVETSVHRRVVFKPADAPRIVACINALEAALLARATRARLLKHQGLVRRVLKRWDKYAANWERKHHGCRPSRHAFALTVTGWRDTYQYSKHGEIQGRAKPLSPAEFDYSPRTIERILAKHRPCGGSP